MSQTAPRGINHGSIYNVPLLAVHHLCESLTKHDSAGAAYSLQSYWATFDLPVIVSCVRLWGVGVESAVGGCIKGNFRRSYPIRGHHLLVVDT